MGLSLHLGSVTCTGFTVLCLWDISCCFSYSVKQLSCSAFCPHFPAAACSFPLLLTPHPFSVQATFLWLLPPFPIIIHSSFINHQVKSTSAYNINHSWGGWHSFEELSFQLSFKTELKILCYGCNVLKYYLSVVLYLLRILELKRHQNIKSPHIN